MNQWDEKRRAVQHQRVQRTPREWRASNRCGLLHSLLARSSGRVYMSCAAGNMTFSFGNIDRLLLNNQRYYEYLYIYIYSFIIILS